MKHAACARGRPLHLLNTAAAPWQAHLHARRGEREQAAHYYKLNLEAIDTMNLSGSDALAALDFLAEHSLVRRPLVLASRVSRAADVDDAVRRWMHQCNILQC